MGNCGSSVDCTACPENRAWYGDSEEGGCPTQPKVNPDIAGIGVSSKIRVGSLADARLDPRIILLQRFDCFRGSDPGVPNLDPAFGPATVDRQACNRNTGGPVQAKEARRKYQHTRVHRDAKTTKSQPCSGQIHQDA